MQWQASLPFLIILVMAMLCLLRQGDCSFVTDEENLRSALLSNYSVKVRPEQQVNISMMCFLASLNNLDITEESMSLTIILYMVWTDSRLAWDNSSYGGITMLFTAPEDIWTPPVVVENAVEDLQVMGGSSRDGTPVTIRSSGVVSWQPPQEVTVSCKMKISNYPFDTQTCTLIIFGWTYPENYVYITGTALDSSLLYSPSGQWDLINTDIFHTQVYDPFDGVYFRKINFEFSFRRKWEFYGQNLVMPIVLNSILMNAVFLLPIESGEKMGYCLTVLLSYVVFLTWVTDNLPPVSTEVSILQVYLAVVLSLGSLATLLTTWVLHLHHQPSDTRVSKMYHRLAVCLLVPVLSFVRSDIARQKQKLIHRHNPKVRPLTSHPASPSAVATKSRHAPLTSLPSMARAERR